MKTIAIILAGGVGSRFGYDGPKQFVKLAGLSVIDHTIKAFNDSPLIDEIIVVIKDGYQEHIWNSVRQLSFTKVAKVLNGGKERSDSSLAAINALALENQSDDFKLLFHDAVRPFVDNNIIQRCVDALTHFNAVDVAINTADTIIEVENDLITNIPNRSRLRRGQTPQAFRLKTIKKAYELATQDDKFKTTDDCGVVCKYLPDESVYVVTGHESNIKITHEQDIFLADKLFQLRSMNENITRTEKFYQQFYKGKTVVVFGGSYGIGLEIVNLAREYGANVFSFSRSQTNTNIENAMAVSNALDRVYKETGQIDYVINTAAILTTKPLQHLSHKEVLDSINVNYFGVVNITKASEKYLEESKGSLLLFTSSSYTRGRANYALYSSSKAAVVNFTQAIAEEWAHKSIRINCINPERTSTPMRIANFGNEPKDSLLDAADVAISSLSTIASDFTGQVIDVRK
jgi:2-C-methyl-D-erythritol 4-phosphate cytidylyltransferase